MTNVMLTCAGRRNFLVQCFRAALSGDGRVVAGDSAAEAPALEEADDRVLLPPIDDPGYVDEVARACQMLNIRLLVPLHDRELALLAGHRDRFLQMGTILVVSEPVVIATCLDKWAAFQFMARHGIATPPTFSSLADARLALERGEINFPLVTKPRWGMASLGLRWCSDFAGLSEAVDDTRSAAAAQLLAAPAARDFDRDVLIQAAVDGAEHGLDVLNDLSGRYVTTFAKRKIVMRAGETDRAVSIVREDLSRLGSSIGQALGHVGPLDCDVIVTLHGSVVIDLNPRFGGGYPFSHVAGANVPAALIAWAAGATPDPAWLSMEANVVSAKCDRLVRIGAKR